MLVFLNASRILILFKDCDVRLKVLEDLADNLQMTINYDENYRSSKTIEFCMDMVLKILIYTYNLSTEEIMERSCPQNSFNRLLGLNRRLTFEIILRSWLL